MISRLDRCIVVMNDVVGAQQHVARPEGKAPGRGHSATSVSSPSAVCTTTWLPTSRSVAGVNTPWPMKSATNRVAGRWYSV
jgi:hypothetical protein